MKLPPFTTNVARILAGGGIFTLAIMILVMLYANPELEKSDLFKSLAQAIIVQGLIGLVMAFLYTGKNNGSSE